ncbi:hypothetical protein FPQ18DRAFT_293390 [Pyronema domesticum]|nr:hypothetical protein FPQ18DRAFT_293390 [Pyronema domesticum]
MNRSPLFSNFRKPHEHLLSISSLGGPTASTMPMSTTTTPRTHTRKRSSGGSSSGSQGDIGIPAEIESDDGDMGSFSRSRSRGPDRSKSRSVSPSWAQGSSAEVPLLSIGSEASSRGQSPHPDSCDDQGERWRPDTGTKWWQDGKLGKWLWTTPRGRTVYISILLLLYGIASFLLLVMNRLLLWTGVYKFAYPLTTTLIELLFTQFFLYASASITRSFSRQLHGLGLGFIVAPNPSLKGKRHASNIRGLRDFANAIRPNTTGGVFEFKWAEAKLVLPLAIIYSGKIMLSNIAFAYTQLQIYQISRVITLIWALGLTHIYHRTQSLTVTTLSSCITMTLSLLMATLRPGSRFAIEGFIAGIFSTFFVSLYPFILSRVYRLLTHRLSSHEPTSPSMIGTMISIFAPTTSLPHPRSDGSSTRAFWKLMHYLNLLTIIILIPMCFITGEFRNISRNCYILDVAWFWLMMLGAGATAFSTFVMGFAVVVATTPLTMVVAAYPRAAVQLVMIMGVKMPVWSWVGVLMTGGGAGWYGVGRRVEWKAVGDVRGRRGSRDDRGEA